MGELIHVGKYGVCRAFLSLSLNFSVIKNIFKNKVHYIKTGKRYKELVLLCSVAKSCPNLRPHGLSMPGSSDFHYLQEFAQTHIH